MHARSALFDLYGDHLRTRASQAPVAALVRLLAPVGIAAPAVRTAVSRMVLQGWLEPVALPDGRGYRATDQAARRLDEAHARIYDRRDEPWDGHWHLVLISPPGDRSSRARLRADLAYLGYAELADHVWVGPAANAELPGALARAGATARTARARDVDPSPVAAWDLAALRASYDGWPALAERIVAEHLGAHADPDEAAFAARFHLVHEWRKFLFADPGLPAEVLPADWPRRTAAGRFDAEAQRLQPAADRFVARCLP
ncbi:PaaX family transcriptional regulator C-terminal domain-containing protein [Nocardioides sp. NPDC092400]|uniref:PaaX family transcriptional regulator n=1 Tax=Nocardioides sp. NPDC092400 TaxID=3155196 RepID=UPI003413E439